MRFEVELGSAAVDSVQSADRPLAAKLDRCFSILESDPAKHPNVKRLKGPWAGYLRYRIGDWRVIYRIEHETHKVYVVAIAHRREIYE